MIIKHDNIEYEVELYPEICCEECYEVVHNHFDCPICNKKYASTSIYLDINEWCENVFECENCESSFEIIELD